MNKYRKNTRYNDNGAFPLFPKLLATSLGVGFLPMAPGTWGALLAIALWVPLYLTTPPWVNFMVTGCAIVVYTLAGTWASNIAEKYWGKDPVVACADETVGQWIALLPVAWVSHSLWWEIAVAFVLFRFFDIVKPLGIRKMEDFPGGWGMMADDILAGIYSVICILILNLIIA